MNRQTASETDQTPPNNDALRKREVRAAIVIGVTVVLLIGLVTFVIIRANHKPAAKPKSTDTAPTTLALAVPKEPPGWTVATKNTEGQQKYTSLDGKCQVVVGQNKSSSQKTLLTQDTINDWVKTISDQVGSKPTVASAAPLRITVSGTGDVTFVGSTLGYQGVDKKQYVTTIYAYDQGPYELFIATSCQADAWTNAQNSLQQLYRQVSVVYK